MPSEVIQVGPMQVQFLVEGDDSGGSVALFEVRVPAGAGMPAPHSHDGYEETLYGLHGVTRWTVDGSENDVGPGQALCIQRGAVHAFTNPGDVDARVLAVVSPGVLKADFFREAGTVLAEAAGGPPDLAKLAEVMHRHGLTPAN